VRERKYQINPGQAEEAPAYMRLDRETKGHMPKGHMTGWHKGEPPSQLSIQAGTILHKQSNRLVSVTTRCLFVRFRQTRPVHTVLFHNCWHWQYTPANCISLDHINVLSCPKTLQQHSRATTLQALTLRTSQEVAAHHPRLHTTTTSTFLHPQGRVMHAIKSQHELQTAKAPLIQPCLPS
jgi:hypothetical protein